MNDKPVVLDDWPAMQPSLVDLLQHDAFVCAEAVVQQLLAAKPSLAVLFLNFNSERFVQTR